MPKRKKKIIETVNEEGKVIGFEVLTNAETRLLEVLKSEDVSAVSVGVLCDRATISRKTYYDSFKRERFRKAVKDVVGNILYASLVPVTYKLHEKAIEFKDHHAARMIFEMTGMLKETATQATQINLSLGFNRPNFEEEKQLK